MTDQTIPPASLTGFELLADSGSLVPGTRIRVMHLDIGGFRRSIYGGPFIEASKLPDGHHVRLEMHAPRSNTTFNLPIPDFSVPQPEQIDAVRREVHSLLKAAASGRCAFVGCMGGTGRTGMILALAMKELGHPRPIDYVRQMYKRGAVETSEQEDYVRRYVPSIGRLGHVGLWLRAAVSNLLR